MLGVGWARRGCGAKGPLTILRQPERRRRKVACLSHIRCRTCIPCRLIHTWRPNVYRNVTHSGAEKDLTPRKAAAPVASMSAAGAASSADENR